ncbi:uncharacterized protein DS421_5g148530 [Arachis hypogaea]|nr:uncharacterized protein DS421_5g148530 [Arachis hypogaea]
MPANPSCMTPSLPGKQVSLGNTGMEQKYTQCTPIKVHPLLKGRKIDENDEERLRRWAANGSLEQSQWMYSTFNDSESLRFKDDFYCIPPRISKTVLHKRNLDFFREVPTVSYVGLGPHFGDDSRFFDKVAASRQKWWFAPICIDRHSWLYAFKISQKRLWVLDSINTGEPNKERLKIHAYAGRLIEDMSKVSIPTYKHTENGLPIFYASVPQQDNGCDCGVFIIKFMQF